MERNLERVISLGSERMDNTPTITLELITMVSHPFQQDLVKPSKAYTFHCVSWRKNIVGVSLLIRDFRAPFLDTAIALLIFQEIKFI